MLKKYILFLMSGAFVLLSAPFVFAADLETALLEENYAQVKLLAQEALAQNPDRKKSNELQYYLALSSLKLKDYAESEKIFQQLSKERLESSLKDKVYLGLYDAYFLEEKYEQALEVAKKLLKMSGRSEFTSLIYLKYARVNLKLAHWTEAHNYLNKILKQFPDSLEVHAAHQLLEENQYFAVQVGSFLDRKRAEGLVEELKMKNEYAYLVETADKSNNKFYRVRVGQLNALEEAQSLKSKLSQAGYPAQIYP